MTKITSSTGLESILDIDKFPTHDFKNKKYVFPNNKSVAFFTLSVMYKCLLKQMLASFSWLMKVQVWNLTVSGRHQSPRSLSVALQRNRGFEVLCVLLLLWQPVDQGWLFSCRQESSPWLLSSCLLEAVCYPGFCQAQVQPWGPQGSLQIIANSSPFWCAPSLIPCSEAGKDLVAVDLSWRTFPLPGSFRGH